MTEHLEASAALDGPFRSLLHRIGWDEFFSAHWGQRPLHVRGCQAEIARLPKWGEFPTLLAGKLEPEYWRQSTDPIQAHYLDREGRPRRMVLQPGAWAEAFNAGLSLCFAPVDRFHPELARLVDDSRQTLQPSSSVLAMAYLTPKHSGSAMHFDFQHVFILQASGEKHWRVARRRAADMPPMNFVVDMLDTPAHCHLRELGLEVEAPGSDGFDELTLREGEMLYLPPGYWHEARTTEQASLHYSLGQFTVSFGSFVHTALRLSNLRHPMWREDLRALRTESARLEFARQRLAELRSIINELTPEALVAAHATATQVPPPLLYQLQLLALS